MRGSSSEVAIECTPVDDQSEAVPIFPRRGCKHYRRGCRLVAPCCGDVVPCRLCHDDAHTHALDRHAVHAVVCIACKLEQPPARECAGCGSSFGKYFCAVCHLYDDDDSKGQFHCDKCGICRVGGRDNFFHCDTCNACYSTELRGKHTCVTNALRRDCPICCEFLFDSREAPQVLPCGHTLHRKCLESLAAHRGFQCPVCSVSVCDMRKAWRHLSEEIAATPMPQEFADKLVPILCNDCHATGEALFHVLGLQCASCGSYNTRQT